MFTHAGTAGDIFCSGVPSAREFVRTKSSCPLSRRHIRVAAVDDSGAKFQLIGEHSGWHIVAADLAVSDSEEGVKAHASRGRKLGPQSPRHLSNRVNSLKRTLMAQTPERRRKRCSICGEIGHNKLSCPAASGAMPRKNTVTCSQCGQPGHNSRSCPVKPRSTTVTCSQCGRDGHNCRTCPMRVKTKKGSKATANSVSSISRVCLFCTQKFCV